MTGILGLICEQGRSSGGNRSKSSLRIYTPSTENMPLTLGSIQPCFYAQGVYQRHFKLTAHFTMQSTHNKTGMSPPQREMLLLRQPGIYLGLLNAPTDAHKHVYTRYLQKYFLLHILFYTLLFPVFCYGAGLQRFPQSRRQTVS